MYAPAGRKEGRKKERSHAVASGSRFSLSGRTGQVRRGSINIHRTCMRIYVSSSSPSFPDYTLCMYMYIFSGYAEVSRGRRGESGGGRRGIRLRLLHVVSDIIDHIDTVINDSTEYRFEGKRVDPIDQ